MSDYITMFFMAFSVSFGFLMGLFLFICLVEWWRER
jgi:hypothetical protein